jgi:hypothetical protein
MWFLGGLFVERPLCGESPIVLNVSNWPRLCKNDGPVGYHAKNGQESPSWKESEELRESIPSELIYTRP